MTQRFSRSLQYTHFDVPTAEFRTDELEGSFSYGANINFNERKMTVGDYLRAEIQWAKFKLWGIFVTDSVLVCTGTVACPSLFSVK